MPVQVRLARPDDPDDLAFLLAQAPRVSAGAPAWHTAEAIAIAAQRTLAAALQDQAGASIVLLAVDSQGARLGFLYAFATAGLFSDDPQVHISDIVVSDAAEGQGVGQALMQAAEAWAVDRRATAITLHVFPANARALTLYQRMGFEVDWLRLYRPLADGQS